MRTRQTLARPLLALLLALAGGREGLSQSPPPANDAGTRSQGERIALRGAGNGIAACSTCHGIRGEGNAAGGIPRIAGMSQHYLARQLHAYADGKRPNAIMTPVAARLHPEQIDALARYYAALTAAPSPRAREQDTALLQRGRQLAETGDRHKQVQACVNCHGPAGSGMPPTFPYLAGQHAAYLADSLRQWKEGQRDTDPSGQMAMIASRLDEQDRLALAAWFSIQSPPAPGARENVPLGTPRHPVPPRAPSAATSGPAESEGTEQGAPTTGGSQGPGSSTTDNEHSDRRQGRPAIQ